MHIKKRKIGTAPTSALLCSIVNVTEHGDRGGSGETRHRLDPQTVARIQERQSGAASGGGGGGSGEDGDGAPGTAAGAPGLGAEAEPASPAPAAKPPVSASASTPAAPTTPPAAAPAEPEPPPWQAAVEAERSTRQLERARNELAQTTRELERMREADRDPMRLLESRGFKMEQVVQDWLGPEEGATSGTGAPAKPAARTQPAEDPRVASLERELAELKKGWGAAQQANQRDTRLTGIKQLVSGAGDALGLTTALGIEESALARIEQLEQERGVQLGQVETMQILYDYEKQTRANVEKQFSTLAKLPWAVESMRKALDGAAGARPAPATPPAPATTSGHRETTTPAATLPGTGSTADAPASPIRPQPPSLSHQELRMRARQKAAALIAKQREGLG